METTFLKKISYSNSPEEFFQNINLSILSGEYLFDLVSFNKIIEDLETDNTFDELSTITTSNTDNQKKSSNDKLVFEKALKIYVKLSKITNENLNYLVNKSNEEFDDYGRKLAIDYDIERYYSQVTDFNYDSEDNIKFNFLIFLLNIKLSELDEYLDSSHKCFLEIDKTLDYLEDLNSLCDVWNSEIVKILVEKAKFLKCKINLRNSKTKECQENFQYYNDFYLKSIEHYRDYSAKFKSKFDKSEKSSISEIDSIKTVHNYNKYIKCISKNTNEEKLNILNNLITKIDSLKNQTSTDFDKFSYISAKNLIKNTELRLKLAEEKEKNYPNLCGEDFYKKRNFEINSFKTTILNNLKNRDFDDYKGYEVVLGFLNGFLDDFENAEKIFPNIFVDGIDESTSKNYIENIKTNFGLLIDFYEDLMNKFESAKNKHINFDLKPIYLTFYECLTEEKKITTNAEELKINLFLDTSYILPIDYQKINQEFLLAKHSYKYRINQIKEKLEVLINYNLSKKSKEEFVEKIKENEFKLVQIIAMFVSIATFVLINVKIFDNKTGSESFGVLLSLAGIFLLFNSFFKWMINDQLYKIKNLLTDYFLWIPILLIVGGSYCIFNSEGNSIIKKIEDKFSKKTDSIIKLKSNEFELSKFKDSINRIQSNNEILKRIEKLEKNK